MDMTKFFDAARAYTGPLKAVQVHVAEEVIRLGGSLSPEHLAYILGTAWGEAKWTPQRENMNYSAKRLQEMVDKGVWRDRGVLRFARDPEGLANFVYGNMTALGNRPGTDDGWRYRGGGVDQLTGRDNYQRIGLENYPEAILNPDKAAWSLVHGLTTGRYTGKRLSHYGDGKDFTPISARAIVNGDVRQNGQLYAKHYDTFLKALQAAGYRPFVRPDVEPAAPAKPADKPKGLLALILDLLMKWTSK
jgi:putative chitinase